MVWVTTDVHMLSEWKKKSIDEKTRAYFKFGVKKPTNSHKSLEPISQRQCVCIEFS